MNMLCLMELIEPLKCPVIFRSGEAFMLQHVLWSNSFFTPQGVNQLTTRKTSHAKGFVNAKSHAREKPLLAGKSFRDMVCWKIKAENIFTINQNDVKMNCSVLQECTAKLFKNLQDFQTSSCNFHGLLLNSIIKWRSIIKCVRGGLHFMVGRCPHRHSHRPANN